MSLITVVALVSHSRPSKRKHAQHESSGGLGFWNVWLYRLNPAEYSLGSARKRPRLGCTADASNALGVESEDEDEEGMFVCEHLSRPMF